MNTLLADSVLFLHLLVVLYIVAGLPFILLGARCGWPVARNPWFRFTHMLAIAFVIGESWLGMTCPLTTLEQSLRATVAGGGAYQGGFIAHWMHALLFHDFAPWIFASAYSAFGLLVLATWWWYPPRRAEGSGKGKRT